MIFKKSVLTLINIFLVCSIAIVFPSNAKDGTSDDEIWDKFVWVLESELVGLVEVDEITPPSYLPANLPMAILFAPHSQLLGGVTYKSPPVTVIVQKSTLGLEELVDIYSQWLTKEGFNLMHKSASSNDYMMYHQDKGPSIQLDFVEESESTLFFITIYLEGILIPEIERWIPRLVHPTDESVRIFRVYDPDTNSLVKPHARAYIERKGAGTGREIKLYEDAFGVIHTPKSAIEVENHYAQQLQKAGWVSVDSGATGEVAWSIWEVPEAGTTKGVLYVTAGPRENEQTYSIYFITN